MGCLQLSLILPFTQRAAAAQLCDPTGCTQALLPLLLVVLHAHSPTPAPQRSQLCSCLCWEAPHGSDQRHRGSTVLSMCEDPSLPPWDYFQELFSNCAWETLQVQLLASPSLTGMVQLLHFPPPAISSSLIADLTSRSAGDSWRIFSSVLRDSPQSSSSPAFREHSCEFRHSTAQCSVQNSHSSGTS